MKKVLQLLITTIAFFEFWYDANVYCFVAQFNNIAHRGFHLKLPSLRNHQSILSVRSQRKLFFSSLLVGSSSNISIDISTTAVPNPNYGAESIMVLEGLEPVRKRPGMYIGSTGQKGLNHLVFELIDNSVDETLAGFCTDIIVEILSDGGVAVTDNGRGIPCSIHPTTGKSSLETVLCILHAGGKFGGEESGYRVSGGLHGVGISVVNALSDHLKVEVVRDGTYHTMSFSKGEPVSEMQSRPSLPHEHRGTKVTFKPDPTIFKTTTVFDAEKIAERLDELAYLNAGLRIKLFDRRGNSTVNTQILVEGDSISSENDRNNGLILYKEYFHEGGIKELVRTLCEGKTPLHPDHDVLEFKAQRNGVTVEVALKWSKDMYSEALSGFANGIRTSDGGSHLDGVKQAISKTINSFARQVMYMHFIHFLILSFLVQTGKLKEKDGSIPAEFTREGLTCVISVKVPEPEFEGQTKTRLGNPEVRQIVDSYVGEAFTTFLEWNPYVGNEICAKALSAQSAALAAKAARDMVRRKSLLTSSVLPGKLADCSISRDGKYDTEIYLVEGDSAAGSAKLGRDRNFQAILPLRGKILNVEKATNEKVGSIIIDTFVWVMLWSSL